MASAVCRLYQGVKLDIGPATDSGFYYDFDLADRITPEDFPRIEEEMARIVSENVPFERQEVSREEALTLFTREGQTYKIERLNDIPPGETISLYRCGDFVDLCRGPHLDSTGQIKAFKLISVAGSYYRGLETNPMLQRIYGIAAESKKAIENELKRIEEAKQRDHRKLGRELDLFSMAEDVGPGLIHWHPKGGRIRSIIEDFWKKEHFKAGYEIVYTPHIGQAGLWETSGHLSFYRENMYSPMDVDGMEYFIKPMNCPFHIQIYKSAKRSYRELPLRWAEMGTVYRYEKSGVLHGLLRVRGFTQDDAHIFCTTSQMEAEIKGAVQFAMGILRAFGFKDVTAYLSTKPKDSVGDEERWTQATESLRKALESENIQYVKDEGGGAFYGPKVDLKIKDALAREWQMSTIQFDFNIPERFDMTYVGEDGKEHRPYMVHRALLGSMERFFGILIEHFGGAFPLWLAPEQVRVLPLTEKQTEYSISLREGLSSSFRVSVDQRSEKIGAKIRRAQMDKIPYMLIVGPKEVEKDSVSVRHRTRGDQGVMTLSELIAVLTKENENKGDNN